MFTCPVLGLHYTHCFKLLLFYQKTMLTLFFRA